MCKKNYSGSGYDMVNHTGSDECAYNIPIANCEFVMSRRLEQATSFFDCTDNVDGLERGFGDLDFLLFLR